MSQTILSAKDLTFRYDKKLVINDLSMTVLPGEVIGIVGKNGCGKTTLLKIITGFLFPERGSISLSEGNNKANPMISGFMETPKLLENLTGDENLRYFLEKQYSAKEVQEALVRWELSEYSDTPVRKYSLGMKQKLGLMMAFLSGAALLVFDEPTNSLDYESVRIFYECVKEASAAGRAVILVTHILYELKSNCSRLLILNDGVLQEEADFASDHNVYRVEFADADNALKALNVLKKQEIVRHYSNTIEICDVARKVSDLIRAMSVFDILSVQKISTIHLTDGGTDR